PSAPLSLHDALPISTNQRTQLVGPGRIGEIESHGIEIRGLALCLALATLWRRRMLLRPLADDLHHLRAHAFQVHAQAFEHSGGDALAFPDKTKQEVLGPDVMMIQASSFIDCKLDHLLCTGCQAKFGDDHRLAAADNELYR